MRRATRSVRPNKFWQELQTTWVMSQSASAVVSLLQLQAPAAGTLTALPPEDVTILRVVGGFTVNLTAESAWTLGLLVADVTFTIGSFPTDSDKRILWSQTYRIAASTASLAGFAGASWSPPGQQEISATTDLVVQCNREAVYLDISPNVKLEAGKALFLCAWEDSGSATLTVAGLNVRALLQRTRR